MDPIPETQLITEQTIRQVLLSAEFAQLLRSNYTSIVDSSHYNEAGGIVLHNPRTNKTDIVYRIDTRYSETTFDYNAIDQMDVLFSQGYVPVLDIHFHPKRFMDFRPSRADIETMIDTQTQPFIHDGEPVEYTLRSNPINILANVISEGKLGMLVMHCKLNTNLAPAAIKQELQAYKGNDIENILLVLNDHNISAQYIKIDINRVLASFPFPKNTFNKLNLKGITISATITREEFNEDEITGYWEDDIEF